MRGYILFSLLTSALVVMALVPADGRSLQQASAPAAQVQINQPVHRTEPPSAMASAEELEKRADELHFQKDYLDALDYYRAALTKNGTSPQLWNKAGIPELQLERYKEARKDFERAIKLDRQFAVAYNNLGVACYENKNYGKALREYLHAIQLDSTRAAFYSNLGAAYFGKKDFEKATLAYSRAVQLDPDIFESSSRTGIAAQLSMREDRAHFDYLLAKLYAKNGLTDRSLESLRRAMEEGYDRIHDVYKDPEFADVRKDARFTELMASRLPSISE